MSAAILVGTCFKFDVESVLVTPAVVSESAVALSVRTPYNGRHICPNYIQLYMYKLTSLKGHTFH